jgi:hypothetical protein
MRKPNAVRVQRWRDKQKALLAMDMAFGAEPVGYLGEILAPPPPSPIPLQPPAAPLSKKCRGKTASANISKNNIQYVSAGIAAPTPVPTAEGSTTQVKKTRKVKPLVILTEYNSGATKKDTSTRLKKSKAKANVPLEGLVASPSGGSGGTGGGGGVGNGGACGGGGVAEAYRTRKRMKRPVNPVKIGEHPDMFQIDKHANTYARVRFSRGQPVVDIRRYTPDVRRAQFYYTANGSMVMSHSEFASLVKSSPRIIELLEQYGGGGGGGGAAAAASAAAAGAGDSGGVVVDVGVEGCNAGATLDKDNSEDTDATLWL